MKLRTFATVTNTFLGAALLSYGQEQQQDRGPASGSPAAQQQAKQPDANSDSIRSGSASRGNPGTQTAGENRAQSRSQAQGQNTAHTSAQSGQKVDWEKAEKSEIPLSGIPDRAKNALTTATKDGKIGDQVTRLTQGGEQVFMAKVNRENEEDLHIYVKEDGTLMKTKQKVDLASAPQSIRSTVDTKMGKEGSEAKDVYRMVADGKTTYIVSKSAEGDNGKKLHIDSSGQVIEMDNQGKTKERAGNQNATEQSRSASPGTVKPTSGGFTKGPSD